MAGPERRAPFAPVRGPSPGRALALLCLAALCACTGLKPDDDRRVKLRGAFIGSTVAASQNGVTLRGQLSWHGPLSAPVAGGRLRGVIGLPPRP